MTADSGTGIAVVRYNVLDLPEEIIKSNGDTVRFVYGAGGAKLRERVIPLSPSGPTVSTDHVGNLVYRDGLLGRILVDGGSIAAKDSTLSPAYEFAYTDHLGSVRALVQMGDSVYRRTAYGPYGEVLSENWTSQLVSPGGGNGGHGEIIEVSDEEEDPGSGGGPRSISLIQTRLDNPYRFGGKERLDASGLDLYDFGARYYNPALPRWLTMDPLAERYYDVSPYVYCAGNAVVLVDPNGTDWYRNDSDNYIWRDTNEGEITQDGVSYKNVGTSATFALSDGSFGIYYQNVKIGQATLPISFDALVSQTPSIVAKLLEKGSPLSDSYKAGLFQECIRSGQAAFINAPETRFLVNALLTVLFLPEEVVKIIDLPKKAFHLLRLEEREGLTIERLIQQAKSVEKLGSNGKQGFVSGRSLQQDFESLSRTYGQPVQNAKGHPIIQTRNGVISHHISTTGGQPTLDLPMQNGKVFKLRYE